MQIRPFADMDTDAVVDLWTQVFVPTASHNDPARAIRNKLALQRELFFVACRGADVAGTVICGYDGHRGWLYSLAVAPQFRHRGIATALVEHAEHALESLGCPKINLQVVASNAAVVPFYRRLGYQVESRISMGKVLE